MTRASKFKQRDVKAMVKGALAAGVTPDELTIGDIKMKLKPPSAQASATELDDEVAEWNRLIEADKGGTMKKPGVP